jgi:hypothetical protein
MDNNTNTNTKYKYQQLIHDLQQLKIIKVVTPNKIIISDIIRITIAVILLLLIIPVMIIREILTYVINGWNAVNRLLISHLFNPS